MIYDMTPSRLAELAVAFMTSHKETTVPEYNDQQVVAAFNSCLDIAKWNKMPAGIQSRFKNLLRAHRIKWVCFSPTLGFGLRVFQDATRINFRFDGDEVEVGHPDSRDQKGWQADLDGYWMRCPAELYQEPPPSPQVWMVKDEYGQKFYEKDEIRSDEDDADVWSINRANGKQFLVREEAQAVADQVGGIVVKKPI